MNHGPANPPQEGSSFAQRALIAGAVAIGAVIVLAFLWYAARTLLLVFAAVLVGVFLHALSDWLRRHTRLSGGWSLAVVILALLLLFGLAAWLFGARLAEQAAQMAERLP